MALTFETLSRSRLSPRKRLLPDRTLVRYLLETVGALPASGRDKSGEPPVQAGGHWAPRRESTQHNARCPAGSRGGAIHTEGLAPPGGPELPETWPACWDSAGVPWRPWLWQGPHISQALGHGVKGRRLGSSVPTDRHSTSSCSSSLCRAWSRPTTVCRTASSPSASSSRSSSRTALSTLFLFL